MLTSTFTTTKPTHISTFSMSPSVTRRMGRLEAEFEVRGVEVSFRKPKDPLTLVIQAMTSPRGCFFLSRRYKTYCKETLHQSQEGQHWMKGRYGFLFVLDKPLIVSLPIRKDGTKVRLRLLLRKHIIAEETLEIERG